MAHPFVPATLLLFVPALLLAWRMDWLRRPLAKWGLGAIAAAIALWSIAHGGMDFDHLKTVKMLIAAATAGLLTAHAAGRFANDRHRLTALCGIAAVSWLVHFNFLAFHGTGQTREFVHLHDVAHYYLGSKYFREIAHTDLYTAMVRAEADRFRPGYVYGEVRDLRDNSLIEVGEAIDKSDVVKSAFSPTRWLALQEDVAFFRATMGSQYRKVLLDFGYNPTPLWTVIGGSLANLVVAGDRAGIRALTAIDPLLEIAMFAAIAWAFGVEIALISMIYFCLLFDASYGWLGGAMLRHLWLAALVGSACLVHKERYVWAGALLAASTLLRVFPIFFALGPLAQVLQQRRMETASHGSGARPPTGFAFGLVVAGVVLVGLTALNPRGLESWLHFFANIQRHVQNIAFNTIGITHLIQPVVEALPWQLGAGVDKTSVHILHLVTLLPLSLVWLFRRAGRVRPLEAMALGFIPIFAAIDLACYYYVALLLLIFCHRQSSGHLALLFAAESISYALRLFEDRDEVIFLYRNAVVLAVLAYLFWVSPATDRSADARSEESAIGL